MSDDQDTYATQIYVDGEIVHDSIGDREHSKRVQATIDFIESQVEQTDGVEIETERPSTFELTIFPVGEMNLSGDGS